MAFSDELKALIDEHDADPETVASTLKETVQPAYQIIHDEGHSRAVAQKSDKIDELKQTAEQLKQERESLKSDVEELRKNQPDLEKWRKEKEEALQRKEQEWKEKYQDLQQKWKGDKVSSVRDRIVSEMVKNGVDEWAAERAVDTDQLRSRVHVDEDGNTTFYQNDGETPLAAENPVTQLAQETVQQVPDHLRTGRKQSFGGARGGGSPGGSGTREFSAEELDAMSDEEYAEHREEILASAG